jgi:uncharacterized protein YaeQ
MQLQVTIQDGEIWMRNDDDGVQVTLEKLASA